MARESYTGPVSSYAGKATGKLAAADAKVREAKAGQRDAEARADAADRRAERLEAALERIGERLDAIERRLDRKAPTVPKAEVRAVEARIDGSGGALVYGLKAIGAFVGINSRQAKHLCETNQIPHFHMGRVICAERAALTAHFKAKAAEGFQP